MGRSGNKVLRSGASPNGPSTPLHGLNPPYTCPPRGGNQLHPRLHQNSMSIQEDSNRGHAFGMSSELIPYAPSLFYFWGGRGLIVYGYIQIFLLQSSPLLSAFSIHFGLEVFPLPGTLSNIGGTTIFNIIVPPVSESKSTSNKPARLASSFSPDDPILLFLPQKYYFRFHVDKSPIATVNDRTSSVRYKQGC